jgi:hypothetical protein
MSAHTDRLVAIHPWVILAESYWHTNPAMAEHLLRTGLVCRQITEATIPADVRDELLILATEGHSPRMARVGLGGWVRAVIGADCDPSKPGLGEVAA